MNNRNVSYMFFFLVFEFYFFIVNICSGILFLDRNIVLVNYIGYEIGLYILRLKMNIWEIVRNFKLSDDFFDVKVVKYLENKFYVLNYNKKSIIIMIRDSYIIVRELKM